MKAITLTQPWATLVAIGAKRIETRSWSTSYRGPLAIHAGKGLVPVGGKAGLWHQIMENPFYTTLVQAEVNFDHLLAVRGHIVATCELRDVRPIGREQNGDATILADDMRSFTPILGNERAFGDYAPGRYAWLLADVTPLAEPIPARGALGLWEWAGELVT